jgi:ribosomal protein S27AE
MLLRCPGADAQRTPKITLRKCPGCGGEVEVFSNDNRLLCAECGYTEDARMQTCYRWCAHADECKHDNGRTF